MFGIRPIGTRIVEDLTGGINEAVQGIVGNTAVEATVVLVKKNLLDFTDIGASVVDRVADTLGAGIVFKLISATVGDKNNGNRGVVGPESKLEHWDSTIAGITPGDSVYKTTFYWNLKDGIPGAFYIWNYHAFEFFLKSVTFENFPGKGRIHFDCNSWVYNALKYRYTRIFFANDTYVTKDIPQTLQPYVAEELHNLRGDDVTGALQEHDRVYGYAIYNDLGYDRPILGGSSELPYPRRGKTQRDPYFGDRKYESRMLLSTIRLDIYVPRDERFGHVKMSDFLGYAIKALVQSFLPFLEAAVNITPFQFDTFGDVLRLYEGGIPLPSVPGSKILQDIVPFEMLKELVRTDGERLLKMPLPLVIQSDKEAWRTDEEFGREMLAGVNPVIISSLQQFPPVSSLDPSKYGNQNSTISAEHIQHNLDGLSVAQALQQKRLFILNHHDALMPYLARINNDKSTDTKIYASRTVTFLRNDGTLKTVAIELSLPNPAGDQHGTISKVFTPATSGVEYHVWQLAKAYACVNDSGVHQLISHWLNTHAVVEPFILATNRQLSKVHPIHKLLYPHHRDTMNINALARQALISSGGLVETTVFPGQYALEMSAVIYKSWNFVDQALPNDLLKRGVAVVDKSKPNGVRLLIEDYPYAVDGLEIWGAINAWVAEYCAIYYPSDAAVAGDPQIQAWWKEVREVGHGDKKDEPWWPQMNTVSDLVFSCTTIIWTASALHAAVNFGQYPYAGYLPNRPTLSRQFMPEPGTQEYAELEKNPDKVFLKTITSQVQTIIGISLIEILSRHTSDEVYLGQRDSKEWTNDQKALAAFDKFGKNLVTIENAIMARNNDPKFKNRNGPAKAPYNLLYPSYSDPAAATGLTGRGIPNSISI